MWSKEHSMYLLLMTAFTTLRIHLGKKVRESGGTVVVMALNLEKGRWCISLLGLPNKYHRLGGFPDGAGSKEPACQCRRHSDMGFIPGLGRSPGRGNDNPLQYFCLENPMDRDWQAIFHRLENSQTRLKRLTTHGKLKKQDVYPLTGSEGWKSKVKV